MARYVSFASGSVPPEIMGIGPVVAIPKALAPSGPWPSTDIGVIELNRSIRGAGVGGDRKAGLNPEIVNPNGGAVALGRAGCDWREADRDHLAQMQRRKARYGIVTMCIGGKMRPASSSG
ncbi:MAG: hypothetical protein R2748_16135 [Bryobacterales bacterium]